MLLLHCLEQFELCFHCKYMYSRSYESVYNLAGKSFEIGFKKHMLFMKQYELFQKKNHKWGVDVKFSLFYVAWESWQTAHYLFTVCTCTLGYDEEGCGFQFRSPGKFSYNQSILWTC